jgi:hypothetical protein
MENYVFGIFGSPYHSFGVLSALFKEQNVKFDECDHYWVTEKDIEKLQDSEPKLNIVITFHKNVSRKSCQFIMDSFEIKNARHYNTNYYFLFHDLNSVKCLSPYHRTMFDRIFVIPKLFDYQEKLFLCQSYLHSSSWTPCKIHFVLEMALKKESVIVRRIRHTSDDLSELCLWNMEKNSYYEIEI